MHLQFQICLTPPASLCNLRTNAFPIQCICKNTQVPDTKCLKKKTKCFQIIHQIIRSDSQIPKPPLQLSNLQIFPTIGKFSYRRLSNNYSDNCKDMIQLSYYIPPRFIQIAYLFPTRESFFQVHGYLRRHLFDYGHQTQFLF